MEKLRVSVTRALFLGFVFVAMPLASNGMNPEGPEAVEEWFHKLPSLQEKVTKLRFFWHDFVTGQNVTAYTIAISNVTTTSPTAFGAVSMFDDALTIGPDPSSKTVGRAQGFYGSADLNEFAVLMSMNLVFTDGAYNGSSLAVLGRSAVLREYREMPIVGGSGIFRLARGIVTLKTYDFNLTSRNSIVEFDVIAIHYL